MSFAVMSAALAATLWSRARGHLTQERFESLKILDLITAVLGGVVGVILVAADGTDSTWAKALTVLAFLTSVLSIWSVLARGTFKVVAGALVLLASLSLAVAVPIVQLHDIAGEWIPGLVIGPVLLTGALFLLAFSMVVAYWGGRGHGRTISVA